MRKTPSKMHMHDMATIDTIVFEVINFLEYPGSDRVKPVIFLCLQYNAFE